MENILYTIQAITLDLFSAFGLFSILLILVLIFIKKPILYKIDQEANSLIVFTGIIFFLVWMTGTIIEYYSLNENDKVSFLNRITGKYWFGFWIQPLLWFTITQLLRFVKAQRNIPIRLLFSILLILSIERMIIIIISFHRDYLPGSWTMYAEPGIYPSNFFLLVILKISLFIVFARIFGYLHSKVKRVRSFRFNENFK